MEQARPPARRGPGAVPRQAGPHGPDHRAVPAPPRLARLRHPDRRRHPLPLSRLGVRPSAANASSQPNEPEKSSFKHKIKTPAYSVEEMGGMFWAYHGPGREQAAAAAHRRLRHRRHHPHARPHAHSGELAPDHGELARPDPHRMAARPHLRVHQGAEGPEPQGRDQRAAREDRVPRVRARHHQAPPARRPLRGLRRLEDRPPGGVPEHPVGRQRRRDVALLRLPDPRAGRRHPHPAPLVHGLCAAEGREGRAGAARQGPRL